MKTKTLKTVLITSRVQSYYFVVLHDCVEETPESTSLAFTFDCKEAVETLLGPFFSSSPVALLDVFGLELELPV